VQRREPKRFHWFKRRASLMGNDSERLVQWANVCIEPCKKVGVYGASHQLAIDDTLAPNFKSATA